MSDRMRKCVHVVNIGDYFPELARLTIPTIKSYAERIGADFNLITQRKFPEWHINYEKMQVYEAGKYYHANFLVDMDVLIHPKFPDFTDIVPLHHVGFNHNYHASSKFNIASNIYFARDGRDVGIASNAVVTYASTHELWEPIEQELPPKVFTKNICMVRDGDIDEFCLSENLARYGLKYTGITWEAWQEYYFQHIGTGDRAMAMQLAKYILHTWKTE